MKKRPVCEQTSSPFVIAEAGVNHNGSREMAYALIDAAIHAGADAVKFQLFKAEKLVTRVVASAEYQLVAAGADKGQLAMLRKLELAAEVQRELAGYCRQRDIQFLTTAFDSDSLRFILDEIDPLLLKIPSGEITNGPFLLEHAASGKSILLSTGMSTVGEIEEALGVLAFGYLEGRKPSREAFREAYCAAEGQRMLRDRVTLLHCTSSYPARDEDINILAMANMARCFGLPIGYSDHSEGQIAAVLATAYGAKVIEKHFTLSRSLEGPDHQASVEPDELGQLIGSLRLVGKMLGDGIKRPMTDEARNCPVVRKTLVASRFIAAGEMFSPENVTVKRTGHGRSPMEYWNIMGKSAPCDIEQDEVLR